MKRPKPSTKKSSYTAQDFYAEAEYADSILRSGLGDHKGCIAALRRSLKIKPTYAPAILSLGSVEYQLGKRAEGQVLFRSLLSLPKDTPDLCEIIDEAGSFLINIGAYEDGLELYRSAVKGFPAAAVLHQGIGCCAGHEECHEEAIAASERAIQLEPDNQKFVNDLGWSLLEAGRIKQARRTLERAVSMDPSDELARENLRLCKEKERQTKKLPSVIRDEETPVRTGRPITSDDLRCQPGLSQAARDRLLAAQPATVSKALGIHGVGRKTTKRLLFLGLLTDTEGVQS